MITVWSAIEIIPMVDSSAKCNTAIEADFDIGAKLCEEGFARGSELEAFAGW